MMFSDCVIRFNGTLPKYVIGIEVGLEDVTNKKSV